MTIFLVGIFLHFFGTKSALALHSRLFSSDLHEMSLNIDMKMIRPVNSSGFSLIFDKNSWTLLQSCNVVNHTGVTTRLR